MIKVEKTTQEISIKHKYCDDCGVEIKHGLACCANTCKICNKDLCNKCVGYEENPTGGDYSDYYCKKCWEIGKEYRDLITIHESEINGLYQEWYDKCRGLNEIK